MTEAEVRLRGAIYRASYVDYPERIARAVSIHLLLDKVRDGAAAGIEGQPDTRRFFDSFNLASL